MKIFGSDISFSYYQKVEQTALDDFLGAGITSSKNCKTR